MPTVRPKSPAQRIDARIKELRGWRGETLTRVRTLIREALPDVTEEWKWDVPVWSHGGIICTGEAYAKAVKLTFAKGASLSDPSGLFNASLGGNARRAIDIREGDALNARAFKALIKSAAAHNAATAKPRAAKSAPKAKVRLLSGGNPQIAKGDGDAKVQEYIAAMPEWKRDIGVRLDALITKALPGVQKAVKWNSPFYGMPGRGWFLAFHVFTKYVKVTFIRGRDLTPMPPVESKDPNARYVHLDEEHFDAAQMTKWVKQAAKLPGWMI